MMKVTSWTACCPGGGGEVSERGGFPGLDGVQMGEALSRGEGGDGAGSEQRGAEVEAACDEAVEIAVVVVLVADYERVELAEGGDVGGEWFALVVGGGLGEPGVGEDAYVADLDELAGVRDAGDGQGCGHEGSSSSGWTWVLGWSYQVPSSVMAPSSSSGVSSWGRWPVRGSTVNADIAMAWA